MAEFYHREAVSPVRRLRKSASTPNMTATVRRAVPMPIYEFRCARCGHEFERLQKIADPDPDRCPECGAEAVSRLISPVGFRLKGGGWYETDFKQSNRRNVAEPGKAAEGAKPSGDKEAGTKPAGGKKEGKKEKPKKAETRKSGDGKAAA